jgi:ribosomal protein S18 acetylase RimI-like enzyme
MTTTLTPPPVAPAGSGIACRPYRGLADVAGMGAANARLRTSIGLLEPIDVPAMEHRYTHLVNSDPLTDCVIVERDGTTAGYARVEWHDLADGDRVYESIVVVEPAASGLGITDALLGWAEARLREIAAGHETSRRSWFGNLAFGGVTDLEASLLAHDYEALRWFAEMLRPDLEDLPDVVVPDGYTLRTPSEAELPAVFEMLVLAFAEHRGEYEAEEQRFDDWVDDPRFRRDLVIVAWAPGDEPAAAVLNLIEAAPDGSVRGLLDGVATHPDHRRRGLARACIAASLRLLRDEGATSAYLGVDTDNHHRALALYESSGFRVASGSSSYRKPFDGRRSRP